MAAITPMRPEHADGFRALVADTLAELGLPADPGEPDLADPLGALDAAWVVEHDGAVAGSVAVVMVSGDLAELRRMYLRPALRGRGTGRALLEAALGWARGHGVRTVRLETATAMADARRLYAAAGFRPAVQVTGPACRRGCDLRFVMDLAPDHDAAGVPSA